MAFTSARVAGAGDHRVARMVAAVTVATTMLLATVAGLAVPSRAWAWANGPDHGNGYGTHDWILDEGLTIAQTRGGGGWADRATALAATDDPDTQVHDFVNHVYQTTGHVYGSAPRRVQALFDQAVSQLRAGDRAGASVTTGLLAHYYGDVCNPLHTDQTAAEEKIHSRYETRVTRDTAQPRQNAGWVVPAPETQTSDEYARTVAAAAHAHASYAELVADYGANGYGARVRAITAESLSSAANGVAAIADDIGRQAGVQAVVANTPNRGVTVTEAAAASASPRGRPATGTPSALEAAQDASAAAAASSTTAAVGAGAGVVWGLALLLAVVVGVALVVLARSRKS